ncbi:hypothetical protein HWV62_18992 [Athelia sp. TMB]|nr:hypothetical protein HWV62_18992 [Athelia sp. TMB]
MRVLQEIEPVSDVIEMCMEELVAARSFKDPQTHNAKDITGNQIFASLVTVLFELLTRFKNAVALYPRLVSLVRSVNKWVDVWAKGITSNPMTFLDAHETSSLATRQHITDHLRTRVEGLVSIVDREQDRLNRSTRKEKATPRKGNNTTGIMNALRSTYDPPGELREHGPRHDNDFLDIDSIRVAPTHEELVTDVQPFLPSTYFEAPHPFPADSMQRLLDIQFRLLREELTAPLRSSIRLVLDDLKSPTRKKNKLSGIIKQCGGKYRGDQALFNVYTNIAFGPLVPDRRGITVGIVFDAPPGRPRSKHVKDRVAFWESKNLVSGGLVALVWKSGDEYAVHLGITASSSRDLSDAATKMKDNRMLVRVAFFDPAVELRIMQRLKRPELDRHDTKILVEAPVLFEAIRPFLEALKVSPEAIPFDRYLVLRPPRYFESFVIRPPAYAQTPGFSLQLGSLFPPGSGVTNLRLSVDDPTSVANARAQLRLRSRLDPSQADAVVDTLTREISLIQGPPGTGKSYTGVELLRVLLANKVGPVLMIALTNHALDHMLCSVLDANITTRMVRLGSRSADERISAYSLEAMEKVAGQSRLDRAFGRNYRALKDVEEEVKKLLKDFLKISVHSTEILRYLEVEYPEHFEHAMEPPPWIPTIKRLMSADGEWIQAGKGEKKNKSDDSIYAFWREGLDLDFLEHKIQDSPAYPDTMEQLPSDNHFAVLEQDETEAEEGSDAGDSHEDPESDNQEPSLPVPVDFSDLHDPGAFFIGFGYDGIPSAPQTDRALTDLLEYGELWEMSRLERERLHGHWIEQVRLRSHHNQLKQFEKLRERHSDVLQRFNEGKDESIAPRIMLVEEAGQVLEAHVLGSLVQTIQHTILIGDPLQLRPTLNNYDNPREGQLYKFDMSLMERLAKSGFPMSCIDVQRRMRPQISSLIRNTLYPRLEDHELVKHYPSVRGIVKDVFFLSHNHRENGKDEESASKFNEYEVSMIKDLVLYLLRQGCYSQDGDIVVLCAYLGQLARVRDALAKEVVVVIDDVDQDALEAQEDEEQRFATTSGVEHVTVGKRVRLRTVDNYQGEEAKIVILSLVRNSGALEDDVAPFSTSSDGAVNIGFLKSKNRTNGKIVALSRAKEGLYILGNAQNLSAKSDMWHSIIEELRSSDSVGSALPIACCQHPDIIEYISKPGQLPRVAPDGWILSPLFFAI